MNVEIPEVTEQKSRRVRTLSWRTRIPPTTRLGTRVSVSRATRRVVEATSASSETRPTTTRPSNTCDRLDLLPS